MIEREVHEIWRHIFSLWQTKPPAEAVEEMECLLRGCEVPVIAAAYNAGRREERARCARIARSNYHWEAWRVADAIEA